MRHTRLLPLLLLLTACNTKAFEQAVAPDPRLNSSAGSSPSPSASASPSTGERPLAPTIAPNQPSPSPSPSPTPGLNGYTDLDTTPKELRPYLNDLLTLKPDLLTPNPCTPTCTTFQPNQPIQRREYARWLTTINNHYYDKQPPNQIRLASPSAASLYTDLPNTDPDFPAIQGLAEAGLIPSPLSNTPTKDFKPNAPLTREDLIRWKVPIDLRSLPPQATPDQIKQNIGYQDTQKLSPAALGAILADHKNGDNANFRRAFGYTTIFQPQRPVTRAEAAAVLWKFGTAGNFTTAASLTNPTPTPSVSPTPTSSTTPPSAASPAPTPIPPVGP